MVLHVVYVIEFQELCLSVVVMIDDTNPGMMQLHIFAGGKC